MAKSVGECFDQMSSKHIDGMNEWINGWGTERRNERRGEWQRENKSKKGRNVHKYLKFCFAPYRL